MSEEELIAKINARNELLAPANRKYYEKILLYTRLRGFTKNGIMVEQNLLDIQSDLIDAQNDGITATEFFGPNPATVNQEILAAMPNNWGTITKTILLWIGAYMFSAVLPLLMDPTTKIDLGSFLLTSMLLTVGLIVVFYLLSKTVYSKHPLLLSIVCAAVFAILFISLVATGIIVKTPWRFTFTGWPSVAFILLVMLAAGIGFARSKEKVMAGILLFALLGSGILGILMRVPALHHLLTAGIFPPLAIILILGLIILWVVPVIIILVVRHKQTLRK